MTEEQIYSIVEALAAEQDAAIGHSCTQLDLSEFMVKQACHILGGLDRLLLGRLMHDMERMVLASGLQPVAHASLAGLILGARIQRAITDNERLEMST